MKVSIIAAIGQNRELGKNNKLIWHIKEDLQRFKSLTKGHPIIMGRKTWDSLPFKPLPSRTNIIITRDETFAPHENHHKFSNCKSCEGLGLAVVYSLVQAVELAKNSPGSENVFIIGGGQIYKEAIEKGLADKLYLTLVDRTFDADTFFPDYSQFKKIVFEEEHDSGGCKYRFLELER
ncbi:MAG: dihydrofolate reductase [Candidatus Levybacteria bacterium]|nr:dihydrofolate reductase [Candidatus Levybacteria bacterium]